LTGQRAASAGRVAVRRPTAGLRVVTVLLGLAFAPVAPAAEPMPLPGAEAALRPPMAEDTQRFLAWVIETGDNGASPFLIIDKVNARAFAYSRQGRLMASSPVLLGLARGDVAPPGIGNRSLSTIGPADRITPAGRFEAAQGLNLAGRKVLWIDYDGALSLHPVITTSVSDRRRERLASATASDNRISYGCINVPAAFYTGVVEPLFTTNIGIVYILPETRSIKDVFLVRGASSP
jgi:hypothetical protein